MRKTSTLIILLSVLLGLQASAQTLINFQGFEGTSSDTWNFTPTPATYNTEGDSIVDGSDDVWAVIQEFTGDIDTSSQGLYFWGMQDINNGNGGGNFYHTLDFDVVNLSAYMGQSVTVSFDYFSDGFDGTDSIEYQIAYDSSNVWAVNGIALNKNTQAWTTVSIQVPMNSPYVRLRLQALQNGSSDFAGFDNVSVSASASLPAPTVTGFELISNTQIAVAFNQPVASPSATNTANYVATPALSYMGAMLSTGMDTVMLNLSSPIVDGTAYQVVIDSIVDTAGTMMAGPDTINFLWNQSTPSLVISEIMYNDPSGPDTLEYIEILNNGSSAAALGGLIMDGVTYEFAPQSLAAGAYVVLARNAANANSVFGVTGALQWTGGSLSNGGEDVAIFNSLGDTIDYVDYDDSAPWNTQADGGGSALVLCDVNTDNNDAANWWISNTVSATVGTTNLFGSPGSANTCATPAPIPTYPIATVTTNDAQGVADSLNTYCKVVGVVVGPDYDGNNGYSFFMYDQTGGINVFNFNDVGTYQVAEGDSLRVIGSIAQFNGLTEIVPDSIVVLSQGNPIVAPSIETTLDESTESEFIQLNGVSIIDTTGWPSANFGNFDILVGADTFTLRIDSDTDIPANWPNAPAGTFNVVGLGSQFDNIGGNNTPPYNDGYQILPRYFTDIDTTSIPVYPISLISTEDGQGVADSLGTYCKLIGTVVGIDYDGNNGINFFMYDQTGGINVFSFTDVGTYQVTEGDSIRVIGEIDQFNGLIEIVPDSIVVLATGVTIKQPTVVTALGENTESEFIKLEDVEIIDTTGWPSANFGNFDILVGTDTFTLRIDSDTDISANWPNAPVGTFDVTGLGSQFDNIGGNNTPPYNDRYQILPRFFTDIDTSSIPPAPSLFINEVMADNQGFISDEHNDANDDWVEIYNPNAMDVDVADMYISDDTSDPTKYRFPTGSSATVIPANGYLIVWCDNQQTQAGPLHTNFVLSETNGGTVRLTHVDGTTLIDEITFNALATNESFGRESDGATNFTTFVAGSTMEPTPGSANGVVGIELLNGNNTAFQAYPNPVDGSEVFFNQMANVVVFNVVGQVVTQARQVNQLSVDGWESGIYLVRTEQGETIRLIVK